jgi:hypothetical protein
MGPRFVNVAFEPKWRHVRGTTGVALSGLGQQRSLNSNKERQIMLKPNIRALSAVAFMAALSSGSLFAQTSLAQDQLSFTRQDTLLGAFTGPHGCATGDFNGDGEADLVFATSDIPTLQILLGRGDGTFQAAPTLPIEQVANRVAVADFNDDGRPDLAATIFTSSVVAIRLGNGDGTFQAAPDVSFDDGGAGYIAAGDFNGDGAQDLAFAGLFNDDNSTRIYLGAGDGTFSQGQHISEGTPGALTVGDFNGDGRRDVAMIDFTLPFQHRLLILLGQGDGTVEPVAQTSDVGPEAAWLTVGDFNGDGRQDVATSDANTFVISVLIGNGDGTFAAAQNYAPAPPGVLAQPLSIEVGDFNRDGKPDLATANRGRTDPPEEGSASVLLGRGDGSFEPAQVFASAEGTQALVAADLNSDGRQDLAMFGDSEREGDSMTVLLNTTNVSETRVTIDIEPASSENRIDPRSHGKIRVAVLTRDGFDATEVDPATIRFGRTGTEAAPIHFALKDIDGDRNTDLVLRFTTQQTAIACGDTSASLSGRTFGGQAVSGSDSIRMVGCGQP